ncbi:MAG: hypothetical protein JSS21_06155 [Proteobacteria bacterium]|nr:hypothetical protein [Pseudomonadota bacterium]
MRSAPAIGFEYRPSRMMALAAALLVVLALAAVALGGAPAWSKAALGGCALVYGGGSLWRYLHPRIRAVHWRQDGSVSIRLTDRAGVQSEAQGVLHDARVLGPLIALQLRWLRGRAALWLLPDNLDADTRRRLRVRLALDGARTSVNADKV